MKYFPGTIALDEMNFELAEGEIHAIVGGKRRGENPL